jgi:hypothetical protein
MNFEIIDEPEEIVPFRDDVNEDLADVRTVSPVPAPAPARPLHAGDVLEREIALRVDGRDVAPSAENRWVEETHQHALRCLLDALRILGPRFEVHAGSHVILRADSPPIAWLQSLRQLRMRDEGMLGMRGPYYLWPDIAEPEPEPEPPAPGNLSAPVVNTIVQDAIEHEVQRQLAARGGKR